MKKALIYMLGSSFLMAASCNPKQNTTSETPVREATPQENPTSQPLYRTSEGTDYITNLNALSSDGKSFVFSVTYQYTVKRHANPEVYKSKELMPLVARSCREVIGKHAAEELSEDNFKLLRKEMFRAVNENIDPMVVDVPLLTLDRLRSAG